MGKNQKQSESDNSNCQVHTMVRCIECCVCGKKDFPNKMNGILNKYGHKYYCKKKLCQQRFIEDAGEIPDHENYDHVAFTRT